MLTPDLLVPRKCVVCGALGSYICLGCERKLHYITQDFCFYCDKISPYGITDASCSRRRELDGFLGIFYYNSTLKNILEAVKYSFALEVLIELFSIINPQTLVKFRYFAKKCDSAVLQPVPLHWQRQNWRGFNQAQILSEFFRLVTNIEIGDLIERKRYTNPQAQTKSHIERFYNVKYAFHLKTKTLPKQVILVDDVVTTGNTIKEIIRLLKNNAVEKVYVFALARG